MSEAIPFSLHFLILLLFHFLSFLFSLFPFSLFFFLSFFLSFSSFLLIQHFKIPHCGKAAIIPHSTFNLPHL